MNRHILHLHKIDHKQLNKLLLSGMFVCLFVCSFICLFVLRPSFGFSIVVISLKLCRHSKPSIVSKKEVVSF